ncbi:hypothetical protein J1N35_007753 [Gossypium stocksii]|uniref:Uncharacterized protein n=1 Tax=Gossypium stocksii TaxID=47602 RepID=A0A9D4AFV4_9ROSI|nr:hypothetical protein J1N35_007753 [Gossypium stocksii]
MEKRSKEKREKERKTIEKEIEKEFEREKEVDQEKRVEKEIEKKKSSVLKEKELVPKSSCYQFQLRYLPNERRFRLFEKGKFVNDNHPLAIEGKEGAIYSFSYDDYYIGKFVDNI